METKVNKIAPSEHKLSLLIVGNNPIELGVILEKIRSIPEKIISTEIAFDLTSLFERLLNFSPNFIIIDDNLGRARLNEAIVALAQNKKTKDIPVTVLKNSNYSESSGGSTILDYILKQNFSADAFLKTLKNALKLRRTQLYLYKSYDLRKQQLLAAVKV